MTSMPVADNSFDTAEDERPPRPAWEFPETAAVVTLVGVGIVAMGGLATGIVRATSQSGNFIIPSGIDRQLVGSAIQSGGIWGSFVLAVVLVGLMGVTWWNLNEWEPDPDDLQQPGELSEAEGHFRRGCGIIMATEAALVVTALAAVAVLVGALIAIQDNAAIWSQDFYAGADALAVLLVAVTGVCLGRRLVRQYSPTLRDL